MDAIVVRRVHIDDIMQYPVGTRRAPAVRPLVAAAAAAIVILNLVDAVFTLLYTGSGLAAEGNPLMDLVLRTSPTAFMAVKLALVSLGVLMLWRLRQRRAAVVGLVATAAAYSTLCLYHLSEAHRLAAL
jgi:hypothetical protein